MERCVVCGSSDGHIDRYATRYLGLPDDMAVVKCGRCTLRRLSPRLTVAEYRKMYEEQYFEGIPEDYEKLASRRLPRFAERIQAIIALMGTTRFAMLDIGAATGEFVYAARQAGVDAAGIELSKYACDRAREKYGIELIRGDASLIGQREAAYDVVHLNHVLEHIVDPHELLRAVARSLKIGGYVVLEIPYEFGSAWERFCEAFGLIRPSPFSFYSVHHPYFYTPKALRLLLELHGFSVHRMSAWREYVSVKKSEAADYCRCTPPFLPELWLRTCHVVLREKGKNNIIVAYARR